MIYLQLGIDGKIIALSNHDIFDSSTICSEELYTSFDLITNDLYYIDKKLKEIPKIEDDIMVIPNIVSIRQARKALHQLGHLASIESYMSVYASEEEKIDWEYATEVRRNHPLVDQMRALLNLTGQDIDNLFALAITL